MITSTVILTHFLPSQLKFHVLYFPFTISNGWQTACYLVFEAGDVYSDKHKNSRFCVQQRNI